MPKRMFVEDHYPVAVAGYAKLHRHSNFSFLDGAVSPEDLVAGAVRLRLGALALTDHQGLYGVVRFAEAAKEVGVPTVFGAELTLAAGSGRLGDAPVPSAARTGTPDRPVPIWSSSPGTRQATRGSPVPQARLTSPAGRRRVPP